LVYDALKSANVYSFVMLYCALPDIPGILGHKIYPLTSQRQPCFTVYGPPNLQAKATALSEHLDSP
jgi:hypothetical protein